MERKTREQAEHEAWLAERRRRQDAMFGLDRPLAESPNRCKLLGLPMPRGTTYTAGDDQEANPE